VNETLDAVLEFPHVEVEQQSDLHNCQFHAGQQLGLMNCSGRFDTLQFDNPLDLD
jgi:hypothetical protein